MLMFQTQMFFQYLVLHNLYPYSSFICQAYKIINTYSNGINEQSQPVTNNNFNYVAHKRRPQRMLHEISQSEWTRTLKTTSVSDTKHEGVPTYRKLGINQGISIYGKRCQLLLPSLRSVHPARYCSLVQVRTPI